jgi:putative transposase
MSRLPRLCVPGLPHHVIWRGNNRQPVFVDATDKGLFLQLLAEQAQACKVQVYAYVLMDNHVHLLANPPTAQALSTLMQAVGRTYVRRFNLRHGRTGTLWEGRFRATVIDPVSAVLGCMVYFDLNPVRAGVVQAPEQYAWSSHGHYIGARNDRWLSVPPEVWALGNTPFAREAAYAGLVRRGVAPSWSQALTDATLKGWAFGSDAFVQALAEVTPRRVTKQKAGRPKLAK